MGGDGLGTSTSGMVHSSPLIAAPRCLRAGNAKIRQMRRGVGSQSVKGSSFDSECSMPNFAQLLGVRARTQAQECVTPKLFITMSYLRHSRAIWPSLQLP